MDLDLGNLVSSLYRLLFCDLQPGNGVQVVEDEYGKHGENGQILPLKQSLGKAKFFNYT